MTQEKSEEKKRLILFITLAVALGWAVFFLIPLLGMTYGTGYSVVILAAAMFTPALSNVLTRLVTKEGFHNMYLRPHFKGHVKTYLLVYFGPTFLLFLSGAVYFLIFPGSFDPQFTALREAAAAKSGAGLTGERMLLITILEIILAGPIINVIPTLGEELGWRGYLLPKLRLFLSDRTAMVAAGAIWGAWHIPVIVMGHNYGTNYWGYPWLGILSMILFCIVLGIIEGAVSIKLESAIPAAMIHSLVNAGAGLPFYMTKGGYNTILGPSIVGVIGNLPFIALAVVLLIRAGTGKREKAVI